MKRLANYFILFLFLVTMSACQKKELPSKKPVPIGNSVTETTSVEFSSTSSPTTELVGAWSAIIGDYVFYFSFCENGTLNIVNYKETSAVGCSYFQFSYIVEENTISISHSSSPEIYSFDFMLEDSSLLLVNNSNIIFPSDEALFVRTQGSSLNNVFAGTYEQCGPRTSENSGGYFSDFDFWHEHTTYGTYIRYFTFFTDGTYSFDIYSVFDDTTLCKDTYHGSYQLVHDGTAVRFDNNGVYNFKSLGNGLFILTDNENIIHLYNKTSSF